MTDLLLSMTPILTWFQIWLWLCLTTCTTITNYKAAIAMRTSNSMTFPWLFGKFSYSSTFPWLSMTALFSRSFQDFPWPWEPCNPQGAICYFRAPKLKCPLSPCQTHYGHTHAHMLIYSLAYGWHLQVKGKEAQFNYFIEVSYECVEDTVDVGRVDFREVGRCEDALGEATALIDHTLTSCKDRTKSMVSIRVSCIQAMELRGWPEGGNPSSTVFMGEK